MSIWDQLEEQAGHALTIVAAMTVGYSTYVCEKCGAFVLVNSGRLQIFPRRPR